MFKALFRILHLAFWVLVAVFAVKVVGVVFDILLTIALAYLAFVYTHKSDEDD